MLATLQAVCVAFLAASTPAAKAAPAAATFEGKLEFQLLELRHDPVAKHPPKQVPVGSATFRLSTAGSRAEVALKVGPPGSQMRIYLRKTAQPDLVTVVSPMAQEYTVQDLKAAPDGLGLPSADADANKPPAIVKLGKGKVAGYACDKIRVTWKRVTTDLCYTNALGAAPVSFGMADYQIELADKLRAAGYRGLPIFWEGGDVQKWQMLLMSSNREPVPAKYLEVPANYKAAAQGAAPAKDAQAPKAAAPAKP